MKMPLLDGSTIDTAHTVEYRSDFDDIVRLHEPFAREQLPWWLSYQTDNGPTNPAFDGLATSGGKTEVTLDAGTTSVDDVTNLVGPTLNWDNWTEIKFFVYGATISSESDAVIQVMLSDTTSTDTITEGFEIHNADNSRQFLQVYSGGTVQNGNSEVDQGIDASGVHSYGFHIYEFENAHSTGHNIDWYVDGQPYDRWPESQGFPAAQDLTFHAGVITENTASAQTATFDGIHLELVP